MKFEEILNKSKEELDSLNENVSFSNWVKPSLDDLKLEYKIEYQIKPLKYLTNDAFPSFQDFLEAVSKAPIISINKSLDSKISYRSHTRTQDELLSLIRSYNSYPEFRNESTIQALYDGFKNNKPMKMPIVLMMPNRKMRIMGGNTRMDVAFQLGINPKVLLVEVPTKR